MEKGRSWIATLVAQVFLCGALYVALNLGQPQKSNYRNRSGRPHDVYFISVRGGFRPLEQQTHLLKQMEKVAKTYKARFVVNISEQGEEDPFAQNASSLFSHLGIPWHTTIDSKNLKVDCFLEEINITHRKKLFIVGVNTGSLQELMRSISGSGNNQLNLLAQTLEAIVGSWVIVVGYHPVVVCEENKEQIAAKQVLVPLHHTFVKYGVNAYLSRQGCVNYTRKGGVAYIGVPEPIQRGPHLTSLVESFQEEVLDGFLLHKVSSLEITTYYVTSDWEVPDKTVEQQGGKYAM